MKTRESTRKPSRVFLDFMEGMTALREAREGKRTLRTHVVEMREPPTVTPGVLRALRAERRISRGVLARCLRTNVRTIENWEQGRARPNAQAALLIHLVRRFPDTVERLAAL